MKRGQRILLLGMLLFLWVTIPCMGDNPSKSIPLTKLLDIQPTESSDETTAAGKEDSQESVTVESFGNVEPPIQPYIRVPASKK